MKTLQEIKESKRLIINSVGADGGSGEIHMPLWKGTVIWSFGAGWEHVSVNPHGRGKCPSWEDMCKIKDMFFHDEECVVQYHPPKSEYVNNLNNCLHLWRPINETLPMPPGLLVGLKGVRLTK